MQMTIRIIAEATALEEKNTLAREDERRDQN